MRADEYLKQYRECLCRIRLLESRKQTTKDMLTHITAQLSGDRVQSSHPHDKFSMLVAELSDYDAKIEEEEETLFMIQRMVEAIIDHVPDPMQQEVLQKNYIELKTMEQIAEEMYYSRTWVYRLKRRALMKVEEIIGDMR